MAPTLTRTPHHIQATVMIDSDGTHSIQLKRKGRNLFTSCRRYTTSQMALKTLKNLVRSIRAGEITIPTKDTSCQTIPSL